MADDDKEDPALTANLSSLAQALPELLERFRAMARETTGGARAVPSMTSAQPAQTLDGPSVHEGAGNSRLELPPVVAPKTELRA